MYSAPVVVIHCHRLIISLFSRLVMMQIEANFDEDEARKCLHWIKLITYVDEIPSNADSIDASHDAFHDVLGDGLVLCK